MTELMPVVPDEGRQRALLRAVGLDRYSVEVQELAIAIANQYQLDLMLKHLVIIEGRPYITRDGLLHVAHRSGKFDGIEVSLPVLDGDYWRATCTVWRTDMTHPFVYSGRYPAKGGNNQKYAPEMATKVAECMSLRRAFDVAAPVFEERWDSDEVIEAEAHPVQTGRERLAAQAAAVRGGEPKSIKRIIDEREAEGLVSDQGGTTGVSGAEIAAAAAGVTTEEYLDAMAATEAAFSEAEEDDEEEEAAIEPSDAAAGQESTTETVPENAGPAPLTKRELNDRIIAATITLPDVARVAGHMFGRGRTLGELSDEERGLLWAELSAKKA